MILRKYYFFLVALLISCVISCKHNYHFNEDHTTYISNSIRQENKIQIDSAREYVNILIDSYQQKIREDKIRRTFYDSFYLTDDNKISASYYLSTTREFLISVYKDIDNKFTIYGSNFPVQYQLLNGTYLDKNLNTNDIETFDIKTGGNTKIFDNEEFARMYDQHKLIYEDSNFAYAAAFSHFRFNLDLKAKYKFIYPLPDTSIIWFRDVKVYGEFIKDTSVKINTVFSNSGIAVLCGSSNISGWAFTAPRAGRILESMEFQELYVRSDYFREILAFDRLRPFAREIADKQAHAQQDQNFQYDSIEFSHDTMILQKKIDSFGIKIKAKNIIDDAKKGLRPGTLLSYYSTYGRYTIQWALINFSCLVIIFLLSILKFWKNNWGPWTKKPIFGLVISINAFCFYNRPGGMSYIYWWPILLVLVIYIILFLIRKFK